MLSRLQYRSFAPTGCSAAHRESSAIRRTPTVVSGAFYGKKPLYYDNMTHRHNGNTCRLAFHRAFVREDSLSRLAMRTNNDKGNHQVGFGIRETICGAPQRGTWCHGGNHIQQHKPMLLRVRARHVATGRQVRLAVHSSPWRVLAKWCGARALGLHKARVPGRGRAGRARPWDHSTTSATLPRGPPRGRGRRTRR